MMMDELFNLVATGTIGGGAASLGCIFFVKQFMEKDSALYQSLENQIKVLQDGQAACEKRYNLLLEEVLHIKDRFS